MEGSSQAALSRNMRDRKLILAVAVAELLRTTAQRYPRWSGMCIYSAECPCWKSSTAQYPTQFTDNARLLQPLQHCAVFAAYILPFRLRCGFTQAPCCRYVYQYCHGACKPDGC